MIDQNELIRLRALYQYDVLDTAPEKEFDDLTELAASICDAPVSMINLIDQSHQWSKSIFGKSDGIRETLREESVCTYTIQGDDVLEIRNLEADHRFSNQSYVIRDPGYKYYLGARIVNPDGYSIGALCVLDYEQRKLSKEKKKQLQILAGEVMARLELKKQNKHLKELNEYKIKLMQMLSHDMRSPLNGIIGMSSLLNDTIDSDNEEKEMVNIIEQSAIQLNQMIDEIMSYATIETKGFRLNRKETDLGKILQNMKNLYSAAAKTKKITLSFTSDNLEKPVQIDEDKFEQIFGNLLSNAIKFTKTGGDVNCSLTRKSVDGLDTLILKVADSGIGMEKNQINHLFESQINNCNGSQKGTAGEKSTGLGLSIIKYFVDLHSGVIDVESKPNEGTEFIISIPLENANELVEA